jgi:MoxR-like ATPase
VLVGYPTADEEFVIVERVTGVATALAAVASMGELSALQQECRRVFVDPALITYVVRLVTATRDPERAGVKDLARFITYGASPRASINLIEGGRALAYLRGRDYLLPEDLTDLAPDVLRHRLVLSYEALTGNMTPDQIIRRLMAQIVPPAKPLESRMRMV